MSVFADAFSKIFGPAQTVNPGPPVNPNLPPPVNQQQQVTNNPATNQPSGATQQSAQTAANGLVPEGADKPPLETYKDIWQPRETDPKNDLAQTQVDPAKLLEAASKVDFSKVIDQEKLAKIAGGGEEAIAALTEILSKQSNVVYGQSVVATNKMVSEAVAQAEARFAALVPGLVKKQAAAETLFSENPAFNNPAVKPVISAIQTQLQEKFPSATAAELNKMAKEVLVGTAQVFNPNAATQKEPAKSLNGQSSGDNEDWSAYLTS